MAEWFRFSSNASITNVGDSSVSEVTGLHNQLVNLWEDSDLVIVDGIVTLNVDTDTIMGCRFVRRPEFAVIGDLSETSPEENDPDIWYSFFVGKGASIFRLRSKFTIYPQYEFFTTLWKEQGPSAASSILIAARVLVQKK